MELTPIMEPRSPFYRLAPEIIQEIGSHLGKLADIYAFARVCRYTYSQMDMKRRQRYHAVDISFHQRDPDPYTLLLEILKNRHLASLVRELRARTGFPLNPTDPQWNASPPEPFPHTPDDILIGAALKQAGVADPEAEILLTLLKPGVGQEHHKLATLTILFLSVSPNLSVAKIESCWGQTSPLRHFLQGVARQPPGLPNGILQKLRVVELDRSLNYIFGDNDSTLTRILPLFSHLRSVEYLAVDRFGGLEGSPSTLRFSASHISKLHLRCAKVGMLQLSRIIRHCKALTELKCVELYGSSARTTNPREIGDALLQHASTLSVLKLNIESMMPYVWTPYNSDNEAGHGDPDTRRLSEVPGIGSLSSFVALKCLEIDISTLLGRDTVVRQYPIPSHFRLTTHLPPNLERLHILGYRFGRCGQHTKQMRHLVKSAPNMPLLMELVGVDIPPIKRKGVPIPASELAVNQFRQLLEISADTLLLDIIDACMPKFQFQSGQLESIRQIVNNLLRNRRLLVGRQLESHRQIIRRQLEKRGRLYIREILSRCEILGRQIKIHRRIISWELEKHGKIMEAQAASSPDQPTIPSTDALRRLRLVSANAKQTSFLGNVNRLSSQWSQLSQNSSV